MTSLNDLQQDLKNVSDNVLSNLSAEERVRMFLKAAAEGQDDRIEMLRDSAPRYEYETRDLEFTHGAIEAYTLSRMANASLERLYTATMMHEAGRNQYVAIVLLNEAVEKLSQGHFTVDEYGNADTPASWPHNYGPQYDPDELRLAEEHLGITFDEFLQASQAEKLPFDERTGPGWLTEEECRDVLERMQLYIDAYDESQRKVGEVLAEELEDSPGF